MSTRPDRRGCAPNPLLKMITHFPTVEVRWFCKGAIPPKILEWFHGYDPEPEEQPPRVDHYLRLMDRDSSEIELYEDHGLRLMGRDSLGIKLREGRIEIKQRHHPYGVIRFGERVAGQVEHWRKWSFELAEAYGDLTGIEQLASSWISVRKKRQLHRYWVTDDKSVTSIRPDEVCDQGCDWELTSVRCEEMESAWWSLGFEAFGEEDVLKSNLLAAVHHILTIAEPPSLKVEDSCSYPRWLQMFGE